MNTYVALIKREILDGKNGYILAPAVLGAIMVLIALIGVFSAEHIVVNEFDADEIEISTLADGLEKAREEGKEEEIPAAVSLLYFGLSAPVWLAFPFVVFFSLLGALYEERRDKSILFWKSMPVSDWQEVTVKLITSVFVSFFSFVLIAIATQLALAVVLSVAVVFQGGSFFDMWPLGTMITSWLYSLPNYVMWILWALPVLAWLLLVSAFAPRMTFMYAVLPPVILMVIEEMVMDTNYFAEWLGRHLGGWFEWLSWSNVRHDIDGPKDILANMNSFPLGDAIGVTLTSPNFWSGIIIAGVFLWGAVEFRKRAI